MEQFHHFGTVFVKEDRETGKVVQKPCLFLQQSRSDKHAIKLHIHATILRDKTAAVTSVLRRVFHGEREREVRIHKANMMGDYVIKRQDMKVKQLTGVLSVCVSFI